MSGICTRVLAPARARARAWARARQPPLGIRSPRVGAASGALRGPGVAERLSGLGSGRSSGDADRKKTLHPEEDCPPNTPEISVGARVSQAIFFSLVIYNLFVLLWSQERFQVLNKEDEWKGLRKDGCQLQPGLRSGLRV